MKLPKSAIWVATTIKYFPIPEYINKDLVTIMVESLTDRGTQEVICASAYFPGDSECVPPACVQELIGVAVTSIKEVSPFYIIY